jgi:ABC-type phosphate/phosphonate transport system substrate-binding protein
VKPLVLAVNKEVQLKAYILVREESAAKNVTDLHGKSFSFPPRSLNHVYLYLHRTIQDSGFDPAGFFAPSPTPANVGQAMDAVVDGVTEGTIVDAIAWDVYCQRKPGRAKKLRVIHESGWFPTATVVYNAKSSDPKVMEKVKTALLASDQTAMGRQMLTLWRLTQFRNVPAEYEPLLASSVKTYPALFKPAAFVAEAPKAVNAEQR